MGVVNPGRPITLHAFHALATASDTIFDAVLYESVAVSTELYSIHVFKLAAR